MESWGEKKIEVLIHQTLIDIKYVNLVKGEIENASLEKLSYDPKPSDLFEGRIWLNIRENSIKIFMGGLITLFNTSLYDEAFMVYQASIRTLNQTSFINRINNTWH